MTEDLDKAFQALRTKRKLYDRLWRYFDGDQPLKYSSERLAELFRQIDVRFCENWCSVVINAACDRIRLERIVVAEREDLTETLSKLMKQTELDLDADDITLGALVCGESYSIAWKEDETEGDEVVGSKVEAYYHDPRMCHIEYDPVSPRKKLFGAKWWEELVVIPGPAKKKELRIRVNLYYPDRIEYWISKKKPEYTEKGSHFLKFKENAENPYNQVPIFHFRRERRKVISELNDILTLQDAVNKLFSDMMVSSEFSAIVQRWVVSNADLQTIKNSPNQNWFIPAGDPATSEGTQVGQFSPAQLGNFLSALDKVAYAIGVISRTPKHYFFDVGGDPSGEALLTQESGLNKKCTRYIGRLANTWQRYAAFLLELETGEKVEPETIEVIFAAPETVQPKTRSEIRKSDISCGLPLEVLLKREGWTDEEIAEMQKIRKAEKAENVKSMAEAMAQKERQFNQGDEESSDEED